MSASEQYEAYLQTEHWQRMRVRALEWADYRCQVCDSPYGLHVHHRTYEGLGNEAINDLTVLCDTCHGLFHEFQRKEAERLAREEQGRQQQRPATQWAADQSLWDALSPAARAEIEAEVRAALASSGGLIREGGALFQQQCFLAMHARHPEPPPEQKAPEQSANVLPFRVR